MIVRTLIIFILSISLSDSLFADIRLPAIFSDGMVLQQKSEVAVWGNSNVKNSVIVTTSWNNRHYQTTISKNGSWKLKIKTPDAGGPYTIQISDNEGAVTLSNVLIGEVWVASGQSNMEMPMKGFKNLPVLNSQEAITGSDNPRIRLFHEKRMSWGVPLSDCNGSWEQASPSSVASFSAVGYWFARILQKKLQVPVGIIEVAWGGTVIEAWMNAKSLRAFPEIKVPKQRDKAFELKNAPTGLFNGMVNPIAGYGIKGVIWYQGEQNRDEPVLYARLFPAMVKSWRSAWGIGNFAFYYAQIAPYLSGSPHLSTTTKELEPKIPYLREAQLKDEDVIPNSGMAVLLDIGSEKTIHPPDKETVSERLSYLALAKTYGWKNVVYSGPVYKSMKIEGKSILLKFDHADKGLVLTDDGSVNFEVAGEDKIFYPANARITNEGLRVSSLYVKNPVAVRYAFKAWIVGNLFNKAGLPASSFRTDHWDAPWQDNTDRKSAFQIIKYNNPGTTVDLGVGLWGWPVPMDFNGDGHMDLLVSSQGKPYNGLYLFENVSGDKMPVFAKPVCLAKSIKDIQVSYIHGKPRITVPGAELFNFKTSFSKEKKKLFPVDSILKDFKKKPRFDQWKLVDYDNDGDLDIAVGVDDWSDYGWDNAYNKAGEWTNGPLHGYVYLILNENGQYINKGRIQVDGRDLDVYGAPSPNFDDFDSDGDLDLICGEFLDKLTWFENIGTGEKPVYAQGRYLRNASGIIKMDLEMIVPVAVDWNRDGFSDLIVGQEDGRVAFIENTGRVQDDMPVFKSPVFFKQQADDLKFGVLATPYSVDWDNDGDEDIICGNSAGYLSFIENLGTNGNMPKWAPPELLKSNGKVIRIQAGKNGSIQGPAEAKWGYTTLSVADWDGDGLKDIIVNSIWGKVTWFKNKGTKSKPELSGPMPVKVDWQGMPPKPAWNWWDPGKNELAIEWRTTPYATDWNKDGLMDLILVDHQGYLSFFERAEKEGKLILEPGERIFYGKPYSGFDTRNKVTDSLPGLLRLNTGKYGGSGRRKFCLTDWNLDGKLDLLVNSENISLLKNAGAESDTSIFTDKGELGLDRLAGHTTSPTVVDWNKDGIPDLLVGAEDGHFYYLPNPSSSKTKTAEDKESVPPGVIIVQSKDPQNLYVASPSIVILRDDTYLASHDWSGPAIKGATITTVYRSMDKGNTWHRIANVPNMRWATLFKHGGSIYIIGVSKSFGDIHIVKSNDGGATWTKPLDDKTGILFRGRFGTAPVPVVVHDKRIWRAFEESPDAEHQRDFKPFVISAPSNADLLKASSWTRTNSLSFNKKWINARSPSVSEGNVVVTPDGGIADILRLETHPGKNDSFALAGGAKGIPRFEVAAIMNVSKSGKKISFDPLNGFIHFPGAESKFTIRYDPQTKLYWTLVNKITNIGDRRYFKESPHQQRNVLSLYASSDLRHWEEHCEVLRWNRGAIMRTEDKVAFQYADWRFNGDDIVAVVRTGWFGKRYHDANYITFHRIKNFRNLTMSDSSPGLSN